MSNYYSQNLSANRLQRCYEIAPDRIKQYLEAEIDTVFSRIKKDDFVLDLGCGYGRIFDKIETRTNNLLGVDISIENLKYARERFLEKNFYNLMVMNAAQLGFSSNKFDLVFCIQNGISAFKEDPKLLMKEALRITKPGGRVLFSSYSDKIWNERLEWFQIQSEYGFIGEIDYTLTGNGIIVCKDGFKAHHLPKLTLNY